MFIKKVFYKNSKLMFEVNYENESERWFGEKILVKFKSFESKDDGFVMDAKEYNTIQEKVVKLQREILKKHGCKTREDFLKKIEKYKKPGDDRDILFLN
jgi:hypothetical protein